MEYLKFKTPIEISYPIYVQNGELANYINCIYRILLKKIPKISKINIWCRGSSGLSIASCLFIKLEKYYTPTISYVKKEGESSHHRRTHLSRNGINIIVDDFIHEGTTVNSIYKKMKDENVIVMDYLIVTKGYSSALIDFIPKYLITN